MCRGGKNHLSRTLKFLHNSFRYESIRLCKIICSLTAHFNEAGCVGRFIALDSSSYLRRSARRSIPVECLAENLRQCRCREIFRKTLTQQRGGSEWRTWTGFLRRWRKQGILSSPLITMVRSLPYIRIRRKLFRMKEYASGLVPSKILKQAS